MRGLGLRGAVLCVSVCALLLAAERQALAASGAVTAPAPEAPTIVETRLLADADRSGQLELRAETVIRVPVSSGRVPELVRESLDGGYADSLGSGLGLLEEGRLVPVPTMNRIEDGYLVATSDFWMFYEGDYPTRLGAFEVGWDGDLVVRTARPQSAANVRWIVGLELAELDLRSLRPAPAGLRRDGSRTGIGWRFAPQAGEEVVVRLGAPWAVEVNADVAGGGWSFLRGAAALLLGALFVPALWLLLGGGPLAGESGRGSALRRQARLLTLAIGAALFAVCADGVELGRILDGGNLSWPAVFRLSLDGLPLVVATAFATLIQVASRPRRHARAALLVGLAAALAFAVLVAFTDFGVGLEEVMLESGRFELRETSTSIAPFVCACVAWVVTVFLLVDGLLRIVAGWLAPPTHALRPGWRLDLVAVAVTLALAGSAAIAYSGHYADPVADARHVIQGTLLNAVFVGSFLLPLAILPGALQILSRSVEAQPFLVRNPRFLLLAFALYLFFVVTSIGGFAVWPSPWSLLLGAAVLAGLALVRVVRLDRWERLVEAENRLLPAQASLLVEKRRELISRALLVERTQRLRSVEHGKRGKSEEGGEAFIAYRDRLAELDAAEEYLERGVPPEGAVASAADRELVTLRLPKRPPVIYPALGVGPRDSWRENGLTALRYGARIAIAPIAYVLFVLVKHDFGSVFDPSGGFELLSVISLLSGELALWLVAAFVFGCLFTWLPWGNGPLKGLLLSLPVIVGLGLFELCPLYVGVTDWGFRCVQVLAFLSVLGLIMDWQTLRAVGLRLRDLPDLYQVRKLRFAAVNLAPFLIVALGIYQQIKAGDPQGAVEQALNAVPSQFPGFEGEGG